VVERRAGGGGGAVHFEPVDPGHVVWRRVGGNLGRNEQTNQRTNKQKSNKEYMKNIRTCKKELIIMMLFSKWLVPVSNVSLHPPLTPLLA
jgi:hypothetical protein